MARPDPTAASERRAGAGRDLAWEVCEGLAGSIGSRRPASRAERVAAVWLRERLAERGVDARLEPFQGYSTFALPYGIVFGLGLAPGLLSREWWRARVSLAALAAALAAVEDDLRLAPLSRLMSRRPSQNIVAPIEARGEARRTLCLMAHIDTSRSGLMFHPAAAPHLRRMIAATSAGIAVQGTEALIGRRPAGRALIALARLAVAGGLALRVERELRGEDVPGANDNSSGAGVVAALGAELAEQPLEATRVVLLVTGCEEAGTLGARAFVEAGDTDGWLFLNFDGVAAPATLRYLPHEGAVRRFAADTALLGLAERLGRERPELGLERADPVAGLNYDTTPVLARGGRALTISAQDGTIPNYHRPTDTPENADRDVLGRALEAGRALVAAVDRGDAD